MFWVVAILSVIAAAASAAGTLYTSNAQQKAAQYNEDVSKKNAETARQQAVFDAQQQREKNRRMLHAQRAAFAASGVAPDSGSALEVQRDSATQGEMDALVSIYTGRSSANSSLSRAQLFSMQGSSARTAGNIATASSLLGSANSTASNPVFR